MQARSEMTLIDSHCHLDMTVFDGDRESVIARAHAVGVQAQVIPATHAAGWDKIHTICAGHPGLYPAYGLHPMYLDRHRPEHLDALQARLAQAGQCVAVGEIGLDFFIPDLDRERQQFYFEAQLALAEKFGLPVIIHARRATEAVIQALRRFPTVRGVIHSYSGSPEQARQLWKMGFLLGFGGPLTHVRARRLQRMVAELPLEQLVLETDSPDQPDADWRGRRNEPSRLVAILEVVAALRRESAGEIAAVTSANVRRLFSLV